MLIFQRERTPTGLIMYALYLYFLGLSFRNTAKALDPFVEKRSHVAVWNWVQLFNPNKFYLRRTRVTAFIIDETMLQIGSDYAWLGSLWNQYISKFLEFTSQDIGIC